MQTAAADGQAHFERLRDEFGFDGGYTNVKDYMRSTKRGSRKMFVPLRHPPGHALCSRYSALLHPLIHDPFSLAAAHQMNAGQSPSAKRIYRTAWQFGRRIAP